MAAKQLQALTELTTVLSTHIVPVTDDPGGTGPLKKVAVSNLVTQELVGLGNVTNNAQLKIASNLSDVADAAAARTNLGLGTAAVENASAFSAAVHTHAAADVTSGTFADARIAASNVTQHVAAINHDALLNYDVAQHRTINDSGTAVTDLWSGSKISTELAGKSSTSHTHAVTDLSDVAAVTGTGTTVVFAGGPTFQISAIITRDGGPANLQMFRSDDPPVVGGLIGSLLFVAKDSNGNNHSYALAGGNVITATDGSEDGVFDIFVSRGGSSITAAGSRRVRVEAGVQVGAPTGGDKGHGTLNVAGDIYKNNTAYTNPDYVFEHYCTGNIKVHADKPGAAEYTGLMPLAEVESHIRGTWRLPWAGDEPAGMFARSDFLLARLEEAYIYLIELNKRLAALEQQCPTC